MQQPIYSIKNLSISNNDHKILNINKFDLHRGAMYLFNGYIGSGKTTLMQIFSKEKSIESIQVRSGPKRNCPERSNPT